MDNEAMEIEAMNNETRFDVISPDGMRGRVFDSKAEADKWAEEMGEGWEVLRFDSAAVCSPEVRCIPDEEEEWAHGNEGDVDEFGFSL